MVEWDGKERGKGERVFFQKKKKNIYKMYFMEHSDLHYSF